MPPKNKGKAKDTSKEASDKSGGGKGAGKLKPATSINVRHILCEKHAKKEEALEKIRGGAKFDDVAREMSEDKARQGALAFPILRLFRVQRWRGLLDMRPLFSSPLLQWRE
jgi:hypothetical protein